MRIINVEDIVRNVKEMCIEANHFLTDDMDLALKEAVNTEKSPLGKKFCVNCRIICVLLRKIRYQFARIQVWQSFL